MVVTIWRQKATKLAASVVDAVDHVNQVPLNSHPKRKMALASWSATRFAPKVVKYWSYAPVAPTAKVPTPGRIGTPSTRWYLVGPQTFMPETLSIAAQPPVLSR